MADIFESGLSALKLITKVYEIKIDNGTFKLFYKATTALLLACSFISSSKQFFGTPISCEVTGGGVSENVLHSFCWMYSTFNVPLDFKGVCSKRKSLDLSDPLYNSYYQWVPLYLVGVAALFYIPRALWLIMEGGLMKFLTRGVSGRVVEDAARKREMLVKTFQEHMHSKFNKYAAWFYTCEQLNFLVVILAWLITDKFLKHQFFFYAPTVFAFLQMPVEERHNATYNPLCEVFPRIASCEYVRYGVGGVQETRSALCILGLNMINDKIFLVLWLWYFFITCFAGVRLLFRLIQLSSGRIRFIAMRMRVKKYFRKKSLKHVKHYITKKCSIGDWFVLYQMSRNMNQRFFAEFLALLAKSAMEPSAPTQNIFEDKSIRLARGDFDLEDDIMEKSLAVEARDHLSSTLRHSSDIATVEFTPTTNPNFRSTSERQPSADGSKDRVAAQPTRQLSSLTLHSNVIDLGYDKDSENEHHLYSVDRI